MSGFRKTVTFREEIYKQIQKDRARCMIEHNEDLTFTAAVNDLLEELFVMRAHNTTWKKKHD